VRRLLHQLGSSLQAPSKQLEGTQHPDRNGQFVYLNTLVAERIEAGEPVVSVDSKKKELIGNYANGGAEWEPEGEPTKTETHDFPDRSLGEFSPRRDRRPCGHGTDVGRTGLGGAGVVEERPLGREHVADRLEHLLVLVQDRPSAVHARLQVLCAVGVVIEPGIDAPVDPRTVPSTEPGSETPIASGL